MREVIESPGGLSKQRHGWPLKVAALADAKHGRLSRLTTHALTASRRWHYTLRWLGQLRLQSDLVRAVAGALDRSASPLALLKKARNRTPLFFIQSAISKILGL